MPGVKQEEVDWTGLNDMLAKHKGPLTKEELQGYLDQHKVKIEEKVLGGRDDWTQDDTERLDELEAINHRQGLTAQEDTERQQLITRENLYSDANTGAAPTQTKFSSYQLPGGENYRELLLKLPDGSAADKARFDYLTKKPTLTAAEEAEHEALNKRVNYRFGQSPHPASNPRMQRQFLRDVP